MISDTHFGSTLARRWRAVAGMLLLAGLAGCEQGDPQAFTESVEVALEGFTALRITPPDQTVSVGRSRTLSALATDAGGAETDISDRVRWRSSDPAVASVSSTGVVAALTAGEVTISAAIAGLAAEATVTSSVNRLVSIEINGTGTANVCQNLALTASGTHENESAPRDITLDVEWQSSDTASAVFSTIDGEQGLLKTLAVNTITVVAVGEGGAESDPFSVTIGGALQAIEIEPRDQILDLDSIQQYTATAIYTDASEADITGNAQWDSASSATVSISNDDGARGLATALQIGTSTISASCGGQSGSTGVSVSAEREVLALRIRNGENPIVLGIGTTTNVAAVAVYSDGGEEDITDDAQWSVSLISGIVVSVGNDDGNKGEVVTTGVGESLLRVSFDGVVATVPIEVR